MKRIIYIFFMIASYNAFSQIISPNEGNKFYYNGFADVTFKFEPRGSGGRAFVHADNNILGLNFQGDFSGGTMIGNNVFFRDGQNSYILSSNLGIGTINPSARLEITSPAITGQEVLFKLNVSDAPQDYIRISNMTGGSGQFIPGLQGYHVTDNRAALYLTGIIEANNDIGVEPITVFDSRLGSTTVTTRPLFSWDSYGVKKMVLNANGSLGIGTTTTGTHKLAVEGSIAAREVKVLASGWADFVFKKEYNLPKLEEVEKHIKEKGHLENIPSEEEVLKNGISLGEMNAKLLQKVEELTLYAIQQQKNTEKLMKIIEEQSRRLEVLESVK